MANVCQFWVEEPAVCIYWQETGVSGICTFEPVGDDTDDMPSKYPNCNYIGTDDTCTKYTSDGSTAYRCILPDVRRNAGRRTPGGGEHWLREWVNGYNGGDCDGSGTDTTCSGYSPYYIAFSSIQPDSITGDADTEGYSTTPSGLTFRLPLSYDIAYVRAQLGRCYWWAGEAQEFTIDSETGRVSDITNYCTMDEDPSIEIYWASHRYDSDLGMWAMPCNGCNTSCPYYTGICWEYCVDEKMRQGDKVLAEQILELRYYLYRDSWDVDKYKSSFDDPEIKAWAGTPISVELGSSLYAVNHVIDTWRVFMPSFEYFNVSREWMPLSAGTPANNYDGDYPTLVRSIKSFPVKPVIRNKFDVLDFGSGEVNVFESANINHEKVTILGNSFWYGSEIYALNLSDPDLAFLPKEELLSYNSLFEMEQAWINDEDKFDDFYSDLNRKLEFIVDALPEKAFTSDISETGGLFFIEVDTFFGDNDIIVFDKGSGDWEYDTIYFKKLLINGVISQTSFSITGEGTVNYLPSYQDNFMAYSNDNGGILFSFQSLISEHTGDSANLAYIYNDAVRVRLPIISTYEPENDTYIVAYRLYKITFGSNLMLTISNGELIVLGNAGYILVVLSDPDNILSNAIKPWEVNGNIYLYYDEDDYIEMELYDVDIFTLPINQFMVKPKDITEFRPICNDTYLTVENIYTYEKHSFEQLPSDEYEYEEVDDSYVGENDTVIYHDSVSELEGASNNYTLTKFGYDPLIISAVIKGLTGRSIGQIKTKFIVWVRQPYCRDVEIYYNWTASYTEYRLEPHIYNFGPISKTYTIDEETGQNVVIEKSYTPPCGDHDLSAFSETGSMWYPYMACDEYARYNIITQFSENDTNVMEVFTDEETYGAHGVGDIRMLGPSNYYGYTCGVHASIWLCRFDWSYCNQEKIGTDKDSSNIFSGYARYRGGMDAVAKERSLRYDGSLPKFGNVYRDFIRSYRSIDNIDYYVLDESSGSFVRKNKWVPANEFYTDLDMSKTTYEYPYLTYSSSDYYNDNSYFMNPFGLLLASSSIEGVNIGEKVDIDDYEISETYGSPIRYRFEEVFNTHSSVAGIYYPYPRNCYYKGEVTPVPVITWFTYRDYPLDSTKSIQWAWREKWQDLERTVPEYKTEEVLPSYYLDGHKILEEESAYFEEYTNPIYTTINDDTVGKHLFLNIEYPEYRDNYMLGEYRLICDEGDQTITITPVTASGYWQIKLNEGPQRCFDKNGSWVDGDGEYKTLYDTCIDGSWVDDVTVFDTGYTSTSIIEAELNDRCIITYDDVGAEVKTYFQRGLNIELNTNLFDYLPYKMVLLESEDYEVRFDQAPTCMDVYTSPIEWAAIEPNEWYPNNGYCYLVDYCCGGINGGLTCTIDFDLKDSEKCIAGAAVVYKYGPENQDLSASDVLEFVGDLFHIPAITVYKSDNSTDWDQVYENSAMYMSTKESERVDLTEFYDFGISAADFMDEHRYLRIVFRLSPIASEVASAGYNLDNYYYYCDNMIGISCIRLYYGELIEAKETLTTYERKYNISYGSHGDFSPHGSNITGSLLYVSDYDRSTVYQLDSINGVVGMDTAFGEHSTMNKVRGRIMKACHSDQEYLPYSNLYRMEEEQVKIHNEIVAVGSENFMCESNIPIGLESQLNDIGLSYPTWLCNFESSVVRPLTEILQRSRYSSCGHKYWWDMTTLSRTVCGPGRVEDTFEYMWINPCTNYQVGMVDALETYFGGMGTILYSSAYLTSYSRAYTSTTAGLVNSSQGDTQTMSIPEIVMPIY